MTEGPSATSELPARRPTVREIAALAGVSTATVSRVLNGAQNVAPQTRRLVLQAVERRPLVGQRTRRRAAQVDHTIAVRCAHAFGDYFGQLLSGVAAGLRDHGRRLLLSDGYQDGLEPSLSDLLATSLTEGAVLILPPEAPEVLAALRATGYPFVVIDPAEPLPDPVPCVSAAHMAGAQMVTDHLVQLGHTRIATIAGPREWLSAQDRLAGYRAALAAHGRLADPEYLQEVHEPNIESGYEAARRLLEVAPAPTAIVGFNDKVAIGAMKAAKEMGLEVPSQLSIVGFDGLELGELSSPRLTTVRQPLEEMARIAVEVLMRIMAGRELETPRIELSTEFVLGASTAAPPG
ncbi:MAG TPA: LacI family DNA-binding transcriptional regulator [Acidimicrobiales bacterium]|nr:LacI family DNA-binding transcriptional regulator [Acidimicrobiales bacterium]